MYQALGNLSNHTERTLGNQLFRQFKQHKFEHQLWLSAVVGGPGTIYLILLRVRAGEQASYFGLFWGQQMQRSGQSDMPSLVDFTFDLSAL